jgi:hypothetical protein
MPHSFFSPSRFFSSTALLAVFAAFSTPSLAQLVTDDTGTQGAGGNELEVSYGQDRTRAGGQTERAHSVPVAYTYGVTDTIDVSASISYSRIRVPGDEDEGTGSSHVRGFGNTMIGAKWRFFENEASGTSLAIAPEIALPVSSRREADGLGTGKTSGNLNFILSQELPFGSIHFNAGVGRDRYRHEDNATNKHFSVSPVWNITEQWALALDVGVDLSRSDGHTVRSKYADIDVTYSLSKDLDLQFGFMRTTDDEHPKAKTNSWAVVATWRF